MLVKFFLKLILLITTSIIISSSSVVWTSLLPPKNLLHNSFSVVHVIPSSFPLISSICAAIGIFLIGRSGIGIVGGRAGRNIPALIILQFDIFC